MTAYLDWAATGVLASQVLELCVAKAVMLAEPPTLLLTVLAASVREDTLLLWTRPPPCSLHQDNATSTLVTLPTAVM